MSKKTADVQTVETPATETSKEVNLEVNLSERIVNGRGGHGYYTKGRIDIDGLNVGLSTDARLIMQFDRDKAGKLADGPCKLLVALIDYAKAQGWEIPSKNASGKLAMRVLSEALGVSLTASATGRSDREALDVTAA